MATPRLLCVVLNWRTPAMTLRATAALVRALDGIDAEVVLVDNDSQDGSEEMLREGVAEADWPVPVRVVQSGRNGGFGAGNNAGIRAGRADGADPDYVYILNSDAFPDAGAVRALVDHLEAHAEAGFAGSHIRGEDGAAHVTAFRFPSILSEFEGAARFGPVSRALERRRVPLGVPETTRAVGWLAGASMMMRAGLLERIGLFDETFFLYFEETDLCLRAARAGVGTHYVCESRVMHIGSVSTGMKTWRGTPGYWFDSRWHYFAKNHGRSYAAAATLAHLAGGLLCRAKLIVLRRPRVDPPGFLRTLVRHDLRALARRRAGPSITGQRRVPGPSPAE